MVRRKEEREIPDEDVLAETIIYIGLIVVQIIISEIPVPGPDEPFPSPLWIFFLGILLITSYYYIQDLRKFIRSFERVKMPE